VKVFQEGGGKAVAVAAALCLLSGLPIGLFAVDGAPAVPPALAAPAVGHAVEQGITIDAAVLPTAPSSSTPASSISSPASASPTAIAGTTQGGGGGSLAEGADALFRFRLADSSGAPLAGAYPAAWMDSGSHAAATCEARVKELVQGSVFARAALDLNVYYVITLNDDATLSIVDPLFGYGGTKLLAMVQLAARGEDWALADGGQRLFISMPAAGGKVAVVDTTTFKVIANLDSGPLSGRVAAQPDGGYVWVAWDGGVDAFDPRTLARVAHLATGKGPHDLAFSDDSRFAFVTNRDAGTVSIVEVARLAVAAAAVPVGRRPAAIAWSRQAQLAYVTDGPSGTIFGVAPPDPHPAGDASQAGDANKPGATRAASGPHTATAAGSRGDAGGAALIRTRIKAGVGVAAIAFPPDGRFGFAVNPTTDQVYILDTAGNRIVQTAHVQSGPDQVTFSADLAYVRHRNSETVLTMPLKSIGQAGTPVTVMDVPAGQHPLGQGAAPSPAASIVRAPGAAAVLIANPSDQAVYYYQEGMAAPMGSFTDFERQPRAVLVLDRTLHEAAPGVYETTARLPPGGHYQLAFFLDAPRIVHCFDVDVATDPQLAAKRLAATPPRVEFLVESHRAAANHPFPLRFRLTNAATGAPIDGLTDVQVLFYSPPGNNRRTQLAHAVAPGVYAADLDLGEPGTYSILVQSTAINLPFHRSAVLVIQAVDGEGAAARPGAPSSPH
jgi:DNA-binding beta-propeller fold protein YncE